MRTSRSLWPMLLAVCAFGGLVARLWNVDFDMRQHLHPDERHWALTSAAIERADAPAAHGTVAGPLLDWLDGQRSPANAYRGTDSFQYGPFMLALTRDTAAWLHDGVVHDQQPASLIAHAFDAVGVDLLDDTGVPRFDAGYQVDLIGRVLGALIDSLTIVVVGLIGRRIAGRRVGLAAAGLYATSVLAIQHAHFLGAEPLLGLTSAVAVLATLHVDRSGDLRSWRTGLVAGLAAGAVLAAKLSGVSVAVVPLALCVWLVVRHRRPADWFRLAAFVAGTGVAFRVLNPGAFNGLGLTLSAPFLHDLHNSLTQNGLDFPPAVQWANRSGFVDGVRWLFEFTVGPGVFVAAIVGSVLLWRRRAMVGRWATATLIGSVAVTLAVVLRSFAFSGRYFFPMLPALHVLAAFGVVGLWAWRPSLPRLARAGQVGAVALGALAVLWAVAFVQGVYGHTNTRVVASEWIAQHVPHGAVISAESWDDALPLRMPGIDQASWDYETLSLWDTDSLAKIDTLTTQLQRVDFVVESSARVWGTVGQIPARYPATIQFFAALDSGALGFERVATFTSPPHLSLFGQQLWRLDDASGEEAFSVYDHPEVRIWHKVERLDHAHLLSALDPWAAATVVHVTPQQATTNGLMQFPDEHAAGLSTGTYDQAFDTTGSPWWHLAGWLVVLSLSAVAAFVLFLPLLRRLPDAGAGVAPLLGLALPAVALFVLVAWCHLAFTRGLVAAVYVLWLGAAALAARRRCAAIRAVWRDRRRTIVTVAVLSLVSFALLVLLRAANPDLWHPYRAGEKPFELTLLTEVLRTRSLPPHDAWVAGGTLNYYYGGYLMLSLPARLLRTSPSVVMNLALAVFGACTAAAAFGLGAAMRARSTRRSSGEVRRAGLLAAAFVLIVPNPQGMLDAVRWLLSGHGTFDWWAPSRVVTNSAAVTEFPAWSLLFGDVHPHVLDLAVLLTVFTLCLAWYLALVHRRTSVALALVVGLLVGLVRATNTWDFPLAAAALAVVPLAAFVRTRRWQAALRHVVVAAVCAVAVWLPYTGRVEVYDAGLDPVRHHTIWPDWAAHWGVFAGCTVIAVLPLAWRWARAHPTRPLAWVLVSTGFLLALPGRSVQVTCVALALAAGVGAVVRRRTRAPGVSALGLAGLAVGWSVVAGIEQVSVRNDLDRMNTVFKGWYQAWLLLAVCSAVCVASLWSAASRRTTRLGLRAAVGVVLAGAMAFAVAAVPARLDERSSAGGLSLDGEAFFASPVTGSHGEGPVSADLPLLRWLRANVRGLVTVAEAPGLDYEWTGRVAMFVGLPTPIGWPYHERQQRRPYGPDIDQRRLDLAELYSTTDPLRVDQILAAYDVRYVVFGVSEQRVLDVVPGGATVLAATCVREVFRSGTSFVAAVDPQCLRSVPLP